MTTKVNLATQVEGTSDDLTEGVVNLFLSSSDQTKLDNLPSDTNSALSGKVDKIPGKGLSTEDYTTTEKNKLAGIEANAEVNNISDVNATDLTDGGDTTLHTHDGRYYTETEVDTLLSGKQNSLGYTPLDSVVAGSNISIDNTDPLNPVISAVGMGTGDVIASGILTNDTVILGNGTTSIKSSSKTIVTTLGTDDTTLPTSKAVKDVTDTKVTGNLAIIGATKTKITYDAKGLVTAGADATTVDIADSTNKRYVTDAQLTVISNTSGTNTGDETKTTIESKLTGDITSHTHDSRYYTETEVNALVSSTGVILYTLNETITLNGNTYQQTANSQNDSRYNKNTPTELTGPTVTGTGIPGAKAVSDAGILTYIPAGPITTNIQIRKVSGSADFTFYSEYYKLSSSGTETLLGTSGTSDQVHSNAFSQFSVTTILPATTFTSTDRLMRKTYYNKVGGGTDPVVGINVEGPTPTFVAVTIPASALSTVNIAPIVNGSPVDTSTLQDIIRHMRSSGMVEKGVITTNGGAGTIDISANDFVTREGTTSDSPLVIYRDAGVTGLSLPANDVSYIYRDYNNGTPIWASTTTLSGFNGLDKVIAYAVARNGTRMNVLDATEINVDNFRKNRRKDVEWDGYTYNGFWRSKLAKSPITASGLNILVGAGKYYWFDNPLTHSAFDTTVAGASDYNNFIYFYNRTGTWTQITGQKSINATQYDNAGTLATMTNNRWRTDWVYLVHDTTNPYLAIILGNAEYTSQALAQVEGEPSVLPPQLDGIATLAGQITIQKSAVTFSPVNAGSSNFASGGSSATHNNLGGLQGGTTAEYYHLTNTEYTNLVTTDNTKTLTNKTFDDEFRVKQIATPTNPSAGYNKLYFKSDGKLYKLDSAGVESEVGGGAGLAWGASITGTSGTGLTTTIGNNSSGGTIGQSIIAGNTQTSAFTLLNLNTGTSTGISHTGLKITSGMDLNAFTQNATNDIGVGFTIGTTSTGVAFSIVGGFNCNQSAYGLVNFRLSNTQSGATVMQKIDLGTSAQGHTGLLINATNASSSVTGIQITPGTSSTGKGIVIGTSTTAGGNGYKQIYTDNITYSSGQTGYGLYQLVGSNNTGTTAYMIYQGTIDNDIGSTASYGWYVSNIGNSISGNAGKYFSLNNSQNGNNLQNRTNNASEILFSRTGTHTTGTKADNFNILNIKRTSIQNGAGGTFTSTGSVLKLENVATQTAGTLTDTVAVLSLVQTGTSTGGHISFNITTPASANVPNNTIWYNGTNFLYKDNSGVLKSFGA